MNRTFFTLALCAAMHFFLPLSSAAQWNLVNTGGDGRYQDIAIMDATHLVIASNNNNYGETVTTSDGGTTWINSLQTFEGFTDAAFAGDSTYYVHGLGSMVKSTDAGANWSPVFFPWGYAYDAHFYSPDGGVIANYAAPVANYAGISTTTDGGNTWDTIPDQGGPYPFSHHVVWFFDAMNGVVAGTQNIWFPTASFIGRTTDGGQTWSRTHGGFSEFPNDIFFIDNQTGFMAVEFKILKTTDGGFNWTATGADTNAYTYSSVCFVNANTGYACGQDFFGDSKIWKTTDGGDTWTDESFPALPTYWYLNSIRCANENDCWCVGDSATVLHLLDTVNAVNAPAFSQVQMQVFPNPAELAAGTRFVTAKIDGVNESGEWKLVNAAGQYLGEWKHSQGIPETRIPLAGLAQGLYLLQWQGETSRGAERILVR